MLSKEDDKNANLSRRIDADLRSKMEASAKMENGEIDAVEDSEYTKDLKKTGKFAWVPLVIIVVGVIMLVVAGLLK
ncbi:hypothetical protein IJI00_03015 [Candidatus Saccharibacteria bacterium]|nr:hypothetical protein [Candidatus Saccharibacteria bacterium]